jgi:aminopeptidase YwaD
VTAPPRIRSFRLPAGLWLTPIVVLLAALVMSACGADNESTPTPTPTTTATATVEPTVTPSPTPAPTPTVAPADPDGDLAFDHVLALSVDIGSRPAGSDAESAAADYISDQLESFGYETEIQEFPFQSSVLRQASLEVTAPEPTTIGANPLLRSASGRAEGELVFADLGLPEDYPPEGANGRIALLRRGVLLFAEKVANAEDAGASAVIIFNNESGGFSGALQEDSTIPVLAISQVDGERLLSLLEEGSVRVSIEVNELSGTSRNVIGRPSDEPCDTISGGHFDSVPQGPGGNDNASGTAAVLELARVVATRDLPGVRCFVLFGAEEVGLLGSRHFVDTLTPEELDALDAMLNFDVVGGEGAWQLDGTPELAERAVSLASDAGIDAAGVPLKKGYSSDHATFLQMNVPAVLFLRYNEDFFSNIIHTAQDTAELVKPLYLEQAVTMGLALLTSLAEEPIPAATSP